MDMLLINLRMAWRGLGANKLRALLTMLGVIIGVGAVIVAITIGKGSQQAVVESLQRLGTNTLTVIPGSQRRGAISFGMGSKSTLKLEDGDEIKKACPLIQYVAPGVSKNSQVKYDAKNDAINVQGIGRDWPTITNSPLTIGRWFTEAENRSRARVVVFGADSAKDFFDKSSPLGKTVRIAGQNFTVIGVMKKKGGSGFRNPDADVYIPVLTAMRRLFGLENVSNITLQGKPTADMQKAQDQVEATMRKSHKLSTEKASDFIIFNQASMLATQNEQQETFGSLIKYLAIVSLVVGGIGIMNIMLVSVTERTREIGIRKAIGARRGDILMQFLIEALFLSLVGGMIGVIVGYIGSNLVSRLNSWRVVIEPTTVIMAFSFSALIGIFFGFYPALKAARLRPIEALRYE
jgi:putative ABC transport system permease protein